MGALLEYARKTAAVPIPTVRSAEPEITACNVSPPPEVPKTSRTRPCFLKMPARWPSRGASTAHSPSCPTATLNVSCADAPETATARGPASRNDNSQRRLRTVAVVAVSLKAACPVLGLFSCSLFRARRNLDELGELFFAQWRIDEFELDRVPLNPCHVLHLVRLQRLFWLKFLDRVCDQILIQFHPLGIHRDRLGIRVHPIDGLAVALGKTHDRVVLILQRFGVDDDGSHRLSTQRRCVAATDENSDLSFFELLHAER